MAKKKKQSEDEKEIEEKTKKQASLMEELNEAVTKLISSADKFVSALAPFVVEAFHREIKNLQATIGQALLPVITVFTDTLRNISGAINDTALALAPLFEKLSNIISGILLTVIQQFAELLKSIIPIIDELLNLFQGVAELLSALIKILGSVASALLSLISSALTGAFSDLKDAVREVIKQLVVFTARLAATFGAESVLNNLIKSFSDPKKGGAVAAPTDSALKSFQSIAEDFTKNAFIATGASTKEDDDKAFRNELLTILKEIRDKELKPAVTPKEIANEAGSLFSWSRFRSGLENIGEKGLGGAFRDSDLGRGWRKLTS